MKGEIKEYQRKKVRKKERKKERKDLKIKKEI